MNCPVPLASIEQSVDRTVGDPNEQGTSRDSM
jgi:hypothetical protein